MLTPSRSLKYLVEIGGKDYSPTSFIPWTLFDDDVEICLYLLQGEDKKTEEPFARVHVEKTDSEERWKSFRGSICHNEGDRFLVERDIVTNRLIKLGNVGPGVVFSEWMRVNRDLEDLYSRSKLSLSEYEQTSQLWKQLAYRGALSAVSSGAVDNAICDAALSFLRAWFEDGGEEPGP